jgi:phosphoribosylglycinamide formyltransferase-1
VSAPLRLGVLASGSGTNLQALLDTVHEREALVVGVASDKPDALALSRAAAAEVPTRVFERAAHASRTERDLAIAAWLRELDVELVVLAGYMQLVSPEFLAAFPQRVINVHPALLPAFPGIGAIEQAIAYGAKITGVTVHFVDEGVDTGPIILQAAVDVPSHTTPDRLHDLLRPLEHRLLPEAVRLFAAGRVTLAGRTTHIS